MVDGEVLWAVEVLLRIGLSAGVVISLGKYVRMQNTQVLIAREGDDCWLDLSSPLEAICLMVQQHERVMLRVSGPEDAALRTAKVLWRVLSSKYSNNIALMLQRELL